MAKFVSKKKNARIIALSILGLYLVLVGLGLALEAAAGSYFAGTEPLAAFIETAVMTVWISVGVLLVSKKPTHPIGWLWLVIPIIVALDHLSWGYAYYGLFTNPGSLPAVEIPVVWNYWNGRTVGILPLTLLFLLFPTGHPLSRRWGWVGWAAGLSLAVHIPMAALAPVPIGKLPFPLDILGAGETLRSSLAPFFWITGVIEVLCLLLATLSLVLRYHYRQGIERQQIKWFAFAASFFIPGVLLIIISGFQGFAPRSWIFTLGVGMTLFAITGMAVASAIAILRYHLWDIDIIIRRTLIYGALTILLGLLYLGLVTLLQNLVSRISGQESPVVIVFSTLIIAALFTPLRRWIQNGIDRRFYRRKYDAEKVLAQFALNARNAVDIDELSAELLEVVKNTLSPESYSLWIKPDSS